MIPTLILLGVLFGRWWRFAIAAAAIGWPLALVVTGVMGIEWGLAGASMLAIANTLAGVVVYQAGAWAIGRLRGKRVALR